MLENKLLPGVWVGQRLLAPIDTELLYTSLTLKSAHNHEEKFTESAQSDILAAIYLCKQSAVTSTQ